MTLDAESAPASLVVTARTIAVLRRFFRGALHPHRASRDAKRRAIVRELIETERNYFDSLLICDEVYYKPLSISISTRSALIDVATLGELFGNIDEIRALHAGILSAMDAVAPRLKTPFPPHPIYLALIAPVAETIPKMAQLYTRYLSSNANSEEILARLKKNRHFRNFLSQTLFNPRTKCQEIEDLLILPTQRIGGYKLLIERVIRYFPAETFPQEREAYAATLEALGHVGAAMNAEKADPCNQGQLLTIAETLTRMPPFFLLLRPARRYLGRVMMRELDLAAGRRGPELCIFVTSDILLVGRKVESRWSSGRWEYVDAIPLSQVRFAVCRVDRYLDRGFELQTDTAMYNCVLESEALRNKFINQIKTMKAGLKKTVERQTQQGAEFMQGLLGRITGLYADPIRWPTKEQALRSLH
jgi:hypothetical protein